MERNDRFSFLKKRNAHKKCDAAEAAPAGQDTQLQILPFDRKDYYTLSLLLSQFRSICGRPAPTQAQWASLQQAVDAEQLRYFLVWKEGRAVGLFSLCCLFSSAHFLLTGLLDDFYLQPEHCSEEAVGAMVAAAKKEAADQGAQLLTAACTEHSRKLLCAAGFEEVRETVLSMRF